MGERTGVELEWTSDLGEGVLMAVLKSFENFFAISGIFFERFPGTQQNRDEPGFLS